MSPTPKHQVEERRLLEEALKPGTRLDRRQFFVAAGAAAATAAGGADAFAQSAATATHTAGTHDPSLAPAAGKQLGRYLPNFVKDMTQLVNLNQFNQGAAYWNFDTFITPVENFFIRNEYATPRSEVEPRVHPDTWRLKIHGDAVERSLEITYQDLLKMPSRTIIATMECAGNGRSLFWEQQNMLSEPTKVTGTGWGLGGIGQAEWQYVPISHILGLVGVKKSARHILFWSGVDNKENKPGAQGDAGRPIPFSAADLRGNDIGLAFRMNGRDLPPDHGGPVRAIVPGWCGAASTKWLTEIKIASHNFWVRLNSKAHVMIGPDYPPPKPAEGDEFRIIKPEEIVGQAVTWSPPRSLITVPLVLAQQPRFPHNYPLKRGELPKLSAGKQTMRGYAWAPQHGVAAVHYRIGDSEWRRAKLIEPHLGRYTWVRFEFPWDPAVGRHVIQTRVTDRAGVTQPESVRYNQGGFDFNAIPRFHIEAV